MAISVSNHFTRQWLTRLLQNPGATIQGMLNQHPYEACIAIPNYKQRVVEHYKSLLPTGLDSFCQQANIPCEFQHFGIIINFKQPIEIILHDDDMDLDEGLRFLMAEIGPVTLKNAYLNIKHRGYGHRNRFPHLNFHVDRTANQPTHYSMYTRDPTDPEQILPRTASTLFTANIIGHLQGLKEGIIQPGTTGIKGTYTVFTKENMEDVFGDLIMEQRWDEPKGTGEIAMLDNLTCLHASYYRDQQLKGYRIGVRYLS